ncbi:single-stranded DNA-binding protein [Campylobacter cuniculorum]|uniref:Single-stranded DNA-binding protein n=2 Tax=Campylobacter cuniculorum TaxID=374106 RepID=A0A1W6BYY7_9BACT|nr:single-stranded DNA-binding protein [Campylobacter cuniculorum]ARJ57250.1 single-stranded DNA binding protein [Campylobacter cuniculorum DSM 23162 = LMG 24588]QOR04688.1 single-stranded DNA-binding protein [Campylobacter cuniculorum]
MFNKVVLVGNLTRDIELRYAQSGSAIGVSGIAVTRKFNVNGEKREETCFIDIAFYGRTAEIANQYLSKGSKVLVEGRLKLDQWVDQNGQNRSKHSVQVENMEMLGSNPNSQENSAYAQTHQQSFEPYKNQNSKAKTQTQQKNQNEEKIKEIDVDAYDGDDSDLPF